MVAETKVKVGGAWKTLVGVQVKVAGAWKTVTQIEGKVAGSWKEFLSAAICSAGTSTINTTAGIRVQDTADAPAHATIGVKWDTDGGVYFYENNDTAFPGSENAGHWQGDCAASEYDGRWTSTFLDAGDQPTSEEPAEDVWRQMSIGPIRLEWDITVGHDDGCIVFELRRRSDQVTILTDAFEIDVEVCDDSK